MVTVPCSSKWLKMCVQWHNFNNLTNRSIFLANGNILLSSRLQWWLHCNDMSSWGNIVVLSWKLPSAALKGHPSCPRVSSEDRQFSWACSCSPMMRRESFTQIEPQKWITSPSLILRLRNDVMWSLVYFRSELALILIFLYCAHHGQLQNSMFHLVAISTLSIAKPSVTCSMNNEAQMLHWVVTRTQLLHTSIPKPFLASAMAVKGAMELGAWFGGFSLFHLEASNGGARGQNVHMDIPMLWYWPSCDLELSFKV